MSAKKQTPQTQEPGDFGGHNQNCVPKISLVCVKECTVGPNHYRPGDTLAWDGEGEAPAHFEKQ